MTTPVQVRMPQGGDAKWLSKCAERHNSSPAGVYVGASAKGTFTVRHYAGDVSYSAAGQTDKNADRLSKNLHDLLAACAGGLHNLTLPPPTRDLHDLLAACADGRTAALFPPIDASKGSKVTSIA
jgi:hypothetical protein